MDTSQLRSTLMRDSVEFRDLHVQHRLFEERLEELGRKEVLDAREEIESKTLKKKKLVLKDRMEEIVRDFRRRQEA